MILRLILYLRDNISDKIDKVLFTILVILISACSSTPPIFSGASWHQQRVTIEELQNWQLRGRVNVQYNGESHTPRIQWEQKNTEYSIRLWGTFNAGNTRITGRPGLVKMERDGDVITASSPEELILQQLGYELPVSYLEYWIRKLPTPSSEAELIFDDLNQLSEIRQDGWTIKYIEPRQYEELILPRRVEITHPRNDIRLRFVGLTWTLDSTAS